MAAPYAFVLPLLRDMRHVYMHPPSEDKTEGHRNLRTLKDENFNRFLAQLQKLEADHQKKVDAGKAAVVAKKAAADKAKLERMKVEAKVVDQPAVASAAPVPFEDVGQENLELLLETVLKEAGA
jgi:hypothetical protein